MRTSGRLIVSAAAAVTVMAGIALFGGSAARSAATATASLRVARIDPLTVRGLDFRSGERVTVTANLPRSRRTARVTADAAGAFTVRLGRVRHYDPCQFSLLVRARGSRGSTAISKMPPRLCAVRAPLPGPPLPPGGDVEPSPE
jgi:hypothetical protein